MKKLNTWVCKLLFVLTLSISINKQSFSQCSITASALAGTSGSVTSAANAVDASNTTVAVFGNAGVIDVDFGLSFTVSPTISVNISSGTNGVAATGSIFYSADDVTYTLLNTYSVNTLSATGTVLSYSVPLGNRYIRVSRSTNQPRLHIVTYQITPPPAPTASAQFFCGSATVANLTATGTGIQWYAASTGGAALVSTTALVTGTTYYASQTVSTCESATRTGVLVTINAKPAAPAAAAQSFCGSTTVASLVPAPSATIKWYTAATGGTALAGTTAINATGTYYAAAVNASGCESATRTEALITINPLPASPAAVAQSFCGSTTVASLVPAPSATIKWYDVATGGAALAGTTAIAASGIYYLSETAGTCESPRTSVAVTVNSIPAAPTAVPQTLCNGTTVADLIATGAALQWYDVATGGTALASATALTTATTYYASQTVNGCESSTRSGVLVTINPTPTVNAVSNQTVCNNTATTAVTFTGTVPGTIYSWTNDNPSIGLAASGTGNLPSFTASNISGSAVTATVTVTPATGGVYAYIANSNSNNISIIYTATNTVVGTVGVGSLPYGVAVSPDASKVYVTNTNSNSVSVINTTTNTVIATVAVGAFPLGISVNPDGSKVYVTNANSSSVSVINTATNTVISTVTVGFSPHGVSVSPDGSKVYVANYSSNNVSVINTATNTVTATVGVGLQPYGVSASPDGSKVYVANFGSNNVSVINTTTSSVVATVPVGSQPNGVAVSLDGSKIYVTNSGTIANSVSVINTTTNTVLITIPVGSTPRGVSVSPDGSKVYVVNQGGTISVINIATNTVVATIPVGSNPLSVGNFIANITPACTGTPQTFTYTVNATPVAPAASAQSFCGPTTVASLMATGTGIKWYTNATGGTALASTTALTTRTYYVSQTVSTCESPRTSVAVTVNITAAPAASAQSFCGSATVSNLIASGTAIQWYDVATGGTPIASTTPLITATNYYASQTIGGCESSTRKGVLVTIKPIPTINAVTNQIVCNGTATTAVTFTGSVPGTIFGWTNDNTSMGLAASGTGNIPGFTAINSGTTAVTGTVTITPSTKDTFAYIANSISNSVSVINTATNTVVATVPVGSFPFGVSVSPDNSKVYVTNQGDNSVSVINTATNTVIATVAVGVYPHGISVSPDGSKVYVANRTLSNVSVINTVTNTVIATVAVGLAPYGVSVSPDGSKVYVTNYTSNNVSIINTVTNSVIATVAVGSLPQGIAVNPDGSKVYVANYSSNNVSVINTATNTVTATVSIGLLNPYGVSVSPNGNKVYVAGSNKLAVINTANNTVITYVTVGSGPVGVTVSPDGSKAYVANRVSNNVSVINTVTNTEIATVPVGSGPLSLGNFIAVVPGCPGTPQTFTITVNPSTDATIAAANTTQTLPVTGITYFSNGCTDNLIAKVNPTGASPMNGNSTAKVWIEGTQPTNYVKRHYEITPTSNATTATGTITLYFTQAEFDDFNSVNAIKLPTGSADASGIANLLIEKRSGESSDGTGLPNTYTGSIITIDPADADIIWNAALNRWEISFDVTGFSGFFVKTQASILPLRLKIFTAFKLTNTNVQLQWQANNEVNVNRYEVESSTTGSNFIKIGTVSATNLSNYQLIDSRDWNSEVRFYRLKMIDNDGAFKYSTVVRVSNKQVDGGVSIYPNPVNDVFTIQITDKNILHTTAQLTDVSGKLIRLIPINNSYQNESIIGLPRGLYILKFADGSFKKLIKE